MSPRNLSLRHLWLRPRARHVALHLASPRSRFRSAILLSPSSECRVSLSGHDLQIGATCARLGGTSDRRRTEKIESPAERLSCASLPIFLRRPCKLADLEVDAHDTVIEVRVLVLDRQLHMPTKSFLRSQNTREPYEHVYWCLLSGTKIPRHWLLLLYRTNSPEKAHQIIGTPYRPALPNLKTLVALRFPLALGRIPLEALPALLSSLCLSTQGQCQV